MKGLILCGGRGTRLQPFTFTRAKPLLPIANKPSLFYALEDVARAGIRSVGVVVSPETAGEVRRAVGDGRRWGLRVRLIRQPAPLGLAHAVGTARTFLGDEPFVVYLGDNLLSDGIAHLVADYRRGGCDAVILLAPVDDPRDFGVAVLDGGGRVVRLVEKPRRPPSNLALVGVYVFSPAVHAAIDTLRPSGRGEYEITDAIQTLVDWNRPVRAHLVRGWWKDTARPEDLLEANRLGLSACRRSILGRIVASEVVGEVVVERGAAVLRSVVRGPAHIAAGALVERSFVGPYTSVGRGARVVGSEVEYSILFDGAEVRALPRRLDGSVIGQGVLIDGWAAGPRRQAIRLMLGDRSRVRL